MDVGKEGEGTLRQTRASRKILDDMEPSGSKKKGMNSSTGIIVRGKAEAKGNVLLKGKKKGAQMSPAVMDVVSGKVGNAVADSLELRHKREQDAIRCGRVLRSVGEGIDHSHVQILKSSSTMLERTTTSPTRSPQRTQESPADHVFEDLDEPILSPCVEVTGEASNAPEAQEDLQLSKGPRRLSRQQEVPTPRGSFSTAPRNVVDRGLARDVNVEALDGGLQRDNERDSQLRRLSKSVLYREQEECRQADTIRDNYRRDSRLSLRDRHEKSMSRSPLETHGRSWRRSFSKSPRRSRSYSPADYRGRHHWNKNREYEEDDHGSPDIGQPHRGYRNHREETFWIANCRRKEQSSFAEGQYGDGRPISPYMRRRRSSRSPRSFASRSPTLELIGQSNEVRLASKQDTVIVKKEVPSPSVALDKRTRRYKQATREAENSQRKKEGKKPFFLSVDSEGKPYGAGKAAWVAMINKLAVGLDPSVTHMRKQTYEDVCTFKDRLNEDFEYSADVNQDYLRSLMGKAVTQRRTELIQMLLNNVNPPKTIDKDVWEKLEKIAYSKQRETRIEHGRYANACRKTLGRTGSLGVHGIREKLHELYGRSPDLDEVTEELERRKGRGKDDVHSPAVLEDRGKGLAVNLLEALAARMRSHSPLLEEDICAGGVNKGMKKVRAHPMIEMNDLPTGTHVEEVTLEMEGNGNDRERRRLVGKREISKDAYIAKLEAKLMSMKSHQVGGSSYKTPMRREVPVFGRGSKDNLAREESMEEDPYGNKILRKWTSNSKESGSVAKYVGRGSRKH